LVGLCRFFFAVNNLFLLLEQTIIVNPVVEVESLNVQVGRWG